MKCSKVSCNQNKDTAGPKIIPAEVLVKDSKKNIKIILTKLQFSSHLVGGPLECGKECKDKCRENAITGIKPSTPQKSVPNQNDETLTKILKCIAL